MTRDQLTDQVTDRVTDQVIDQVKNQGLKFFDFKYANVLMMHYDKLKSFFNEWMYKMGKGQNWI